MNCLITGINGFLGKIISEQISISNKVWGLSRSSTDYNFCLENEIPKFDLQFELVIHAAGKAHSVPKTIFEKQNFHNINVVGTQNLLNGLIKSGLPKFFVYISSVSVYGQESGMNINENYPLLASDPYGISKIKAESLVLEWCKKHNIICLILRLPLIVGANPPGNLREMINAIQKGYYFNIGGGKAKKSMVLAEDIAKIILVAAPIGGIYNLTDGYHPSFLELSNCIAKKLGKSNPINMPLLLIKLIALFGDLNSNVFKLNSYKLKKIIKDLTFDDSKARTKIGWNSQFVLDWISNENTFFYNFQERR